MAHFYHGPDVLDGPARGAPTWAAVRSRPIIAMFALAVGLSLLGCKGDPPRGATTDAGDAAPARPEKRPAPARVAPAGPDGRVQVVVVGGGIAGLVAAYELEKAGLSVHVLEATDVWGGRIASAFYEPGLQAEYGMQEIWTGNPLLDIARELNVEIEGEVEPADSSVLIDGKVHPFLADTTEEYWRSMFTAGELRALHAWLRRAQALYDTAHREGMANAEIARLRDESFEDWIEREGLPPKVAEMVRLTIECELAADWSGFSALVGLLEYRVFLGDVSAHHVAGGNVKLVDALVSAIRGGKTLGATVTRVRRETTEGRTNVKVTYLREGVVRDVEADRVVVAVPFVRLHQIQFEPPLSEPKWRAVMSLQRGHYVSVHFHVDKQAASLWEIEGVSPFPVLSRGPLGVIYGVNEESAASQRYEVFSLLVYGAEANAFHMVPRERKVKELLAELDALWPGLSSHVRDSHVWSYHPAAVPVWPPGRAPIDELGVAALAPEDGLYLTGDWTWSAHSEGAVRSAQTQARKLIQDLGTGSPPPNTR
jgi:monoamine oxidase